MSAFNVHLLQFNIDRYKFTRKSASLIVRLFESGIDFG